MGINGNVQIHKHAMTDPAGTGLMDTLHSRNMRRRVFNLGFHSFRHTAISELANAGVAKERRMKLSGHKSNVHERYTHHELETLRGDVEKVRSFVK